MNNGTDDMDAIRDFRKELKLSITLLSSPAGDDSIAVKYGVPGTPTTLILDAEGKVTAQIIGANNESIDAALAKLGFID